MKNIVIRVQAHLSIHPWALGVGEFICPIRESEQ